MGGFSLRSRGLAVVNAAAPLVMLGLLVATYFQPLPEVHVTSRPTALRQVPVTVDVRWPAGGEAAIGVGDGGVVASTVDQTPLPTASTAKMMTALVVVEQRPLAPGQQGPSIPITAGDAATYQRDASEGQSVVPVVAGEELTEYQALQALMLPSANNIATLLAEWVFGSLDAGVAALNERARRLQLHGTHFADASGFDPDTVSTPADLVVIGEAAMRQPVLAEIVGQTQADLPVAGTVTNVNTMLGVDGIVGIKTGNTDEAGGCFVFAAPAGGGGDGDRPLLVVGAIMGMPDLGQAMAGAPALVEDARAAMTSSHVVDAGQVVGSYRSAWGRSTALVAASGLDVPVWQGSVVRTSVDVHPLPAPVAAGARVGTLTVTVDGATHQVPVRARSALPAPDWRWRTTRQS